PGKTPATKLSPKGSPPAETNDGAGDKKDDVEKRKASKPVRSPESAAASQLKLAKALYSTDRKANREKVRKRLQTIVAEFPETDAAKEANEMLKELDKQ